MSRSTCGETSEYLKQHLAMRNEPHMTLTYIWARKSGDAGQTPALPAPPELLDTGIARYFLTGGPLHP